MQIEINVNSKSVDIQGIADGAAKQVMSQVISRGQRAALELKNSAGHILTNISPSPPGSPPGERIGNLRRNWRPVVVGGGSGGSVSIQPTIYSDVGYAGYLEDGTSKMEARPFRNKVIQDAEPKVMAIYAESYL